jgi:hypothetical protein
MTGYDGLMKHVKTVLFLLLCLAAGVGIGKAYIYFTQPGRRGFEKNSGPPLVTGVGDAPAVRGFVVRWDRLPDDATLKQWEDAHATAVGILYDPRLTEQNLVNAAKMAHSRHFQVVLLPATFDAHAGGEQVPFPNGIMNVARMARQAKVDYFCVSDFGTEPNVAYWRSTISDIRSAFKGKIILAARWQAVFKVDCWDLADVLGVIGPLPLPQRLPDASENVTIHDERVAWDCLLTSLDTYGKINRRKVALLNMNIPVDVSTRMPPAGSNIKPPRNPALQEMIYEALLLETKGRAEMEDVLLFSWGDERDGSNVLNPNKMPELMAKVHEYWDPQKPKPVETAPSEEVNTDDTADADMPADN